jgi:methylthioribose-1-phosphate isomerase
MYPVIEWKGNRVYMIDQRLLPEEEKIIEHTTHTQVSGSIKDMVIRGAPAIGVAAAMGVALGVVNGCAESVPAFDRLIQEFARTRPTARNLFWALERMRDVFLSHRDNPGRLKKEMVRAALQIELEDVKINKKIGCHGEKLIRSGETILTHCNAGALATAGYGTALGVIRAAIEQKKTIQVIADETRPYLQGARLTVWELQKERIPVKLVTDNSVGFLMARRLIDRVIVGADRIARNGDTANKIGTYSIAVLAHFHHIPFYVAAPLSTIDFSIASGRDIIIEERGKEEIIQFRGDPIANPETEVMNPVFDITPYHLINAIITEKGVISSEFERNILALRE